MFFSVLFIMIAICSIVTIAAQAHKYHNEQTQTINNLIEENKELVIKNEELSIQCMNARNTEIREYIGKFTLTYYCISGTTASGNPTIENITVAVDPNVIPLHTPLYIDGLGVRIAHDTGGVIKGNKIDVYVKDYDTAIQNGVTRDVDVWMIR